MNATLAGAALLAVAVAALPAAAQAPGAPDHALNAAIAVDGDALCPAPAEVAARLPSLLRADGTSAPGPARRARVDARDGAIALSLTDERGRLVAARKLEAHRACDDLAQASAVILATWLATIAPGEIAAVIPPQAPAHLVAPPPAEAEGFVDVGAGAQVSLAEAASAPGLRVQMIAALPNGLGVLVGGQASARRSASFAEGSADWRRSTIDVGAAFVKGAGHWQLGGVAGLQAGWLSAEGSGFPIVHGGTRWSPGAFALGRVAKPFGRIASWLSLGISVPLIDSRLVVVGSGQSHDFRPLELSLTVGMAFGRFQ